MGKGSTDHTHYIDARNLLCPLPVLKLRKALKTVNIGEMVEIETTDPVAAIDIPHYCQEEGQEMIETVSGKTTTRFMIKRIS